MVQYYIVDVKNDKAKYRNDSEATKMAPNYGTLDVITWERSDPLSYLNHWICWGGGWWGGVTNSKKLP